MKKCSIKMSLILNILIFIMMVFASVVMFSGFKFMNGASVVLESTKIGMFRFFTVQSNIFMGIVALMFAIDEIRLLKCKIKNIPLWMYVLKMCATTSVFLTFFVVFTYLGNIVDGGVGLLLQNSNLFFHLIIPVVSIFIFILFEKNKDIKFKYTLYGIIPSFLYEIYYIINILIHMEGGKVSPVYDWYYFVQNGVSTAFIVAPMMLFITFILCLIIWGLNRIYKK